VQIPSEEGEVLLKQIEELRKENTQLRFLLARAPIECIYCGKIDMSECPSGFPGCGRADDLMHGFE
jgi:hypothetical protein